jgi:hypothetical protein
MDDIQCPSGRTVILRAYYLAPDRQDRARVQLWVRLYAICMPGPVTQPTGSPARVTVELFTTAERADEHDERLKRLREAAADYFTERLDRVLGGETLDKDLWQSADSFFPAYATQVITDVNKSLNDSLAGSINKAAIELGSSDVVADIGAGIAANQILAPVNTAVRETTETIEFVGLWIAVILGQPHLAIACAKAIIHSEAKKLCSEAIATMLKGPAQPEQPVSEASPLEITISIPPEKAEYQRTDPVHALLAGTFEPSPEGIRRAADFTLPQDNPAPDRRRPTDPGVSTFRL